MESSEALVNLNNKKTYEDLYSYLLSRVSHELLANYKLLASNLKSSRVVRPGELLKRWSKAIGPFLDLKLTRDKAGARHVKLYLLLGAGPTWSGPPAILDTLLR